jgi:hypothetical protein
MSAGRKMLAGSACAENFKSHSGSLISDWFVRMTGEKRSYVAAISSLY